ncbi:sulfurase [Mycolicibacterium sp. GF69]|uniref:MOSC domain-containing protein n=1 Tax=Mycolicibacterium sp. GF69 TaxID=2267251 RepID=UPI000DCD3DA0|nr:MOSC domain-containing protein [Mycolicibacterium sp. GF69]RAV08936.1 sulfurase [Mycolicibacterium sp. GF69]
MRPPRTGAHIGRLWQYPVKSMMGEEVEEVTVGPGGVVGDRAYGFLDVETGKVVSAKRPKRYGALMQCRARFLSSPQPDAPVPPIEVTFPDGAVVQDDPSELARRVSTLVGRDLRLLASAPEGASSELALLRIQDAEAGPFRSLFRDDAGERVRDFTVGMAAPGTLLDIGPLHVLSARTLRGLAAEYPAGDWDPRRLRPNLLIDDGGDLGEEDDWLNCDLHLGAEAVAHVFMPVPRCAMTTLPQPGLPRDLDVLQTIARVGRKQVGSMGQFPCAGSYAKVVRPGVVHTGDPVFLRRVEPV